MHTLDQEHLTLQMASLKAPAVWANDKEGLAFLFPKTGGGRYVCGANSQGLCSGDVFVSNGGRGGTLSGARGGEMIFRSFSLRFEHLFPLFGMSEISLIQAVKEKLEAPTIHEASSRVAKECHRLIESAPKEPGVGHRSHLLHVATLILAEEFKAVQRSRASLAGADAHVVEVLEKLSAHEVLSSSVQELAGRFGCSRRHLCRLFHQHFGFSAAALRMEMRVVKAASLLRNPDAKVSNVAEQCGFSHPGLFNSCFKKRFGTSPGAWRKQASQTSNPCAVSRTAHGRTLPQVAELGLRAIASKTMQAITEQHAWQPA